MTAVWEGRLSELVKALTSRRESSALELVPDLLPVLDVFTDSPEYAFQRGERYMGVSGNCAAVAGQVSGSRIRNPAGSGALVTVEGLRHSGAAQTITLYLHATTADLATTYGSTPFDARDSRYAGTPGTPGSAAAVMSAGTQVAAHPSAGIVWKGVTTGTWTDVNLPKPIVLIPGWAVTLGGFTANSAIDFCWSWEERPGCNPDELLRK